ncbi:LysR family transcriptional regulator [Streptomyces sp. CHD11]|uniref:LysR family transcriptional regulator n=1 Tax=Streptomyces sp. CHD11 TaxID=2741325 RepID=UPI001BFCAE68|nr:LysR substrate-binding domain-containing protein [Streptomyces sp. CHD11]MBT3153602.1 LysR family transcriptional regulator [Streptomyces sp. CHD11]
MSDLELRHLRYLIAVGEAGSVTRAAEQLMITQPALSRALRALERRAGVTLLVRGSRGTELTAAGWTLLTEARDIVERSRTALERTRGVQAETVTLTVSVAECDVVAVSAVCQAFEESHPGTRVHVVPREWTLPPDDLRAGEADVTFLRDCYDRHDLVVDQLALEPRSVLLSAGHHLADGRKLTVSDLRDEPVTLWAGMSTAQVEHWTGADTDRSPRRRGPSVRSTSDVLNAVILGRAIAFAHGSTLPDALPGIRIRPVEGLSPSRLDVATSVRATRTPTVPVERFVEYARQWWAEIR